MSDRTRIDNIYQLFRANPECAKAAREAFMSFAADVLMCGGNWKQTRKCVGNALSLSCEKGEIRAYADKERLYAAFPFLREGEAA